MRRMFRPWPSHAEGEIGMKPIRFKEENIVYAKNQDPYLPLPAFKHKDDWKCVSSCWGIGFIERLKVLVTGRIWVSMPTFGKPLTPVKLSIDRPNFNE